MMCIGRGAYARVYKERVRRNPDEMSFPNWPTVYVGGGASKSRSKHDTPHRWKRFVSADSAAVSPSLTPVPPHPTPVPPHPPGRDDSDGPSGSVTATQILDRQGSHVAPTIQLGMGSHMEQYEDAESSDITVSSVNAGGTITELTVIKINRNKPIDTLEDLLALLKIPVDELLSKRPGAVTEEGQIYIMIRRIEYFVWIKSTALLNEFINDDGFPRTIDVRSVNNLIFSENLVLTSPSEPAEEDKGPGEIEARFVYEAPRPETPRSETHHTGGGDPGIQEMQELAPQGGAITHVTFVDTISKDMYHIPKRVLEAASARDFLMTMKDRTAYKVDPTKQTVFYPHELQLGVLEGQAVAMEVEEPRQDAAADEQMAGPSPGGSRNTRAEEAVAFIRRLARGAGGLKLKPGA